MERKETVLHFLFEFSMNLEHKRIEQPTIIGLILIKKTEKPYLLKPLFLLFAALYMAQPGMGAASLGSCTWVESGDLWDFAGF